jgi:S-adenosylmethionine:tRNA ribosyltransferase-isomerase
MKPGKRIKAGDRIRFGAQADGACLLGRLDATVVDKGEDGEVVLRFDLAGPRWMRRSATSASCPCPPISRRSGPRTTATAADYQTLFAKWDGSVAAPTAGLHFTPD